MSVDYQGIVDRLPDSKIGETCPACEGRGEWFSECCSGAYGCTCNGREVYMGACQACNGSGVVDESYRKGANILSIAGLCYLGSGPK